MSPELCWFLQWHILQCCQRPMLYMNINMQYWEERFKKFVVQMEPKDEFFPIYDRKSEWRGSIAPYILNLCSRWRWLVSAPPAAIHLGSEPSCPLIRRLCCSQAPSRRFGVEIIYWHGRQSNPVSSSQSPSRYTKHDVLSPCLCQTQPNLCPAPYTLSKLITKVR